MGTILASPGGFPRGRSALHDFPRVEAESPRISSVTSPVRHPPSRSPAQPISTPPGRLRCVRPSADEPIIDGVAAGDPSADQRICSAKGCRQPAHYALTWNNPKLHTPDRRKTWLACPDHRESLAAFLSARGFLRDVETLDV